MTNVFYRQIDNTIEPIIRVNHVHLLLVCVDDRWLIFIKEIITVDEATCERRFSTLLLANQSDFEIRLSLLKATEKCYITLRTWIDEICITGEEVSAGTRPSDRLSDKA